MHRLRTATVAAVLLALLIVAVPASAESLLDQALAAAAQTAPVRGTTECLLATNAGTTEGGAEASWRYFGHGMVMPFYAMGRANRSPAEPPADLLVRYPGALSQCYADGYRDARRRARRITAFYGTLTTVSLVTTFFLIPKLVGGSDYTYPY